MYTNDLMMKCDRSMYKYKKIHGANICVCFLNTDFYLKNLV